MMARSEVRIGDLPSELKDELKVSLLHTMACFFVSRGPKRPLVQSGSGTFVQYGNDYGIMTAAHVVSALQKEQEIALFVGGGRGYITLETNSLNFLDCGKAADPESGPDIGFIKLPHVKSQEIAARKSFVNLETQVEKLKANKPHIKFGVWCITGFPHELGSQNGEGRQATTTVFGQISIGTAERYEERGSFDYYSALVDYESDEGIPNTFQGISGGALWQVTIRQKNKVFKIADRYFSGVVFYETKKAGSERFLRCHGRKSIYDYALPHLICKNT